MVNVKREKLKTVKRTNSIFEWQDQALNDIIKKHGESKDYHHRQALTEYISNHYPEMRGK